jgi:hypothetical protein
MKYVNKPLICITPLQQRGECDEKGLASTPYDPFAWPASQLFEDTIREICGSVYRNESLSICRTFQRVFLAPMQCFFKVLLKSGRSLSQVRKRAVI